MRVGREAFLLIGFLALWTPTLRGAEAATCNSDDSVVCRTVVDTVDQLRLGDFSAAKYDKISVTCYHAPSATAPVCAGGGDFDKRSETGTACASIADGAYVIADGRSGTGPDCFQRENFGVSGIVDARQCGIVGDGANDESGILNLCLSIAAALQVPVVNTGGGIILVSGNDLTIPANVGLTCGGDPGGQRPQLAQGSGATQYYTLPKSIVLNPAHKIVRSPNSHFFGCLVRPDWYNYSLFFDTQGQQLINTTRDVLDKIEEKFSGTATSCGSVNPDGSPSSNGEACDMNDVMIIGFDVCDDTANAPRAILRNLRFECNVPEFIHANGGGMKLENLEVHNFIEAQLNVGNGPPPGIDISKTQWTITKIAASAGGEAEITFDSGTMPSQLVVGDTILMSGIGALGLGTGPQAQGGRWQVDAIPSCSSACTIDLKGSQWSGPTYASSSWIKGSNVVSVFDTTNIAGGQYLCASGGTTPFCAPPTGFAVTGSFALAQSIGATNLPSSLGVNTTANWPQIGLVQITSTTGTEWLGYRVVDASHIQITSRNADDHLGNHMRGTGVTHSVNDAIIPSAPLVIAPVPSVHRVIVSAAATAGASGYVTFLSDPFAPDSSTNNFCTAGADSTTPCGAVILTANYRTWTAKGPVKVDQVNVIPSPAGSTPDATLTVTISDHNGRDVTLASPYAFKAQEGMSVVDVTNNNTLLGYIDQTPTMNNHIHLSNLPGGVNAHQIRLTGCGYPGLIDTVNYPIPKPWLGNCAATALLLYGTTGDYGASGTACDWVHAHGWRVYMHMNNGQETVCNKIIFDSGSSGTGIDNNATADPTSVGIWIEGDGDKIELADGKAEARNAFLNTGTAENNGANLSNFSLTTNNDNSVVFTNTGRTNISQIHGSASGAVYADGSELSLTLTGVVLPGSTVYFDDPAKLTPSVVFCANNLFATSLCGNPLGLAGSGTTVSNLGSGATVTGNDTAGRITAGSGASATFSLNFGTAWQVRPVCFAQDESATSFFPIYQTTAGGVTSVSFKASSPPVNGDIISYQCMGFR